ncbi:DNA mismatch repair protein MutS [Gracilaria domingensis]|nr:DNA mismatch repair protein MutS [Gracilaria domingensis]
MPWPRAALAALRCGRLVDASAGFGSTFLVSQLRSTALRSTLPSHTRFTHAFSSSSPVHCSLSFESNTKESIGVADMMSTVDVNRSSLSPMMQHYVSTKHSLLEKLHIPRSDSLILLYRVGDFFESFFEDAHTLSSICEIALTSKDAGKALGTKVPMAGVPHYCIDEKIKLLIENNLTVAVVDQVETAAQTQSGKLVKRAVTRLITPGTACDEALLESDSSSYIASVVVKPARANDPSEMQCEFGFSYADVSTGEFRATDGSSFDQLQRLLATVTPAEILISIHSDNQDFRSQVSSMLSASSAAVISQRQLVPVPDAERILAHLHQVDHVESLDCRTRPFCTQAAAALINYVQQTAAYERQEQSSSAMHLNALTLFSTSQVMLLDAACLRNLEVIETVRDGVKERSLQWAIGRTVTSMGARCLRGWLLAPSLCPNTIAQRQMVVQGLLWDGDNTRQVIQRAMKSFADLERLGGRMCTGRTTPREMRWLCESILQIPTILSLVFRCLKESVASKRSTVSDEYITNICSPVSTELVTLAQQVTNAVIDPAPAYMPSALAIQSGGISRENWDVSGTRIFRDGYNEQLDSLRKSIRDPGSWISSLEEQEKKRSSVETMRIKHIKNMGYVLRIPRSVGEKIMTDEPMFFSKLGYDRVQSTKAELRFRFEQLRACELSHNSAFAEVLMLELRLFGQLRERLAECVQELRRLGRQIASIDVLAGFAEVAEENGYVRPQILPADARVLELKEARHPVVEQTLPVGKSYVPNSFYLGQTEASDRMDLMILCGPNAAGKSCALRSMGLISIMAQTGCFVPARSAVMSISDRIFTRVGAVDDLAQGQSTFQVEMAETACILSNVSSASLVLLDEIGRGTSTVDGVAIAWSVAEYLAKGLRDGNAKPRTVFVTHYHELNHLSSMYDNIASFHLHVVQSKSLMDSSEISWVATHKVMEGPSFESLGLAVAERAGLPGEVMERARHVASLLHIPSKAIGAELRSALTEGKQESTLAKREIWTSNKALHADLTQDAVESYEKGFSDGYTKAISELQAEFDAIFNRKR